MFRENEALRYYALGTRFDPFPGWYPAQDTGSNGLAVCKAAQWMGEIKSWSTAFTTDELFLALQYGPVGIGSVWTERMFDPEPNGDVIADGAEMGGHQFLCRGYDAQRRLKCDNSWGVEWGISGSFYIPLPQWERLRARSADVVVPRVY